MLKKLLSICLILSLSLGITACSSSKDEEPDTSPTETEETSTSSESPESEDEKDKEDEGKTPIKLYYFNSSTKEIFYVEEKIDCENESAVEDIYNLLKKSPSSELTAPISAGSIITLAEQFTYPDTAFIAFKKNFIETQGFSSEDEKLALQCIAFTYANFFGPNVTKAIITLEGHPYKSKGIKIDEDHPIPADSSSIKKFEN